MSGIIKELPPLLRDKIAAGEVVERPASVIKELVENSIDAGATSITVEIEKGGREFISVADNGSGIEPEYLKTAFLPHATSKISSHDDLENIITKGFRGEALASIAAVSELQVVSKVEHSEYALSYSIIGGVGNEVVPAGRDTGTTISVSNLFYNTPARLKFLKKDVAEGNAVVDTLTKIALAHPEISFKLLRDGQQVLQCRADGDSLVAVNSLISKEIHRYLKPLIYDEDGYEIKGFVGTAEGAKPTRAMQYFYVNGRYIKNKSFSAAVEQAVSGFFMHGKHPIVFVFLNMPTELVDVNVHPAKTEVRFAEERRVFSAIYRAIKSALMPPEKIDLALTMVEAKSNVEEKPHYVAEGNAEGSNINRMFSSHRADVLASPSATYSTTPTTMPRTFSEISEKIDIVYQEAIKPQPTREYEQQSFVQPSETEVRLVGEVFSTYIVLEADGEIIFMDKHAAHERIIYERLIKQRGDDVDSQLLLTPLAVDMDGEHKSTLLDNLDYLYKLGIELEDFGGSSVRIYSLPADIDGYNAELLLNELAECLNTGSMTSDERTRWILNSVACRAAVKAGDKLSNVELLSLAKEIYCGAIPQCCPHGRPVIVSIGKKELEGKFGR